MEQKDGMRLDGELADAKNDLRRAEETAVRREVDLRRAEEKAKRLEVDLRRAEETTKKREANLIRAEETRKKREAALIQAVETAKMREGELVRAAEETAKRREVELAQAAEETAKTREAEHVRAAEETAKKWEVELASMTEDRKKLQDSKKKLTLENKLLKQSLVELKDKMVKLEADLGNATMEKKSLIASLDDYRSKAEKLLEDYKSKAKKLQTDCENIQANHQMALDKCDGELLELICERDHCEAALIKSKSMLEKLEKEHTSLQKDYETLNSLKVKEQAGFQLACEASEKTTKKMEVQLQTCRAELSRLSRESHTSIKQKDSVVEKLIAAVSKAEKAKDSAVKELEQKLHLESTSVRRELAIAAKEKNSLAISEASLIQKLDEATKTIRLLNEQQTVSAEEIRSSKLTNHSLVQEIKSTKKKQEEIELELFKLLQEKEASKKAQCELNAEVFKLKEELERIYKEKESLSASVECSNAKIEELNALVEYWAQKKNTLKQQVEDLHCKLSDLDIEKNELAKRFEHECTNVSLLKFKMTWALKEKDHIAAFANENINALVRKADSLNKQQQQQQAILVSEKKSSAHANDLSMQVSKNLLVTIPLLDKEKDSFSPSKTEEVLTSEEALKTEHDSAMEVHHVKAALDVTVKEEVEPFAESSLQQKLDYVAGMMDSFVEQIAAKVKENDAMRAELTLMEKKSIQMQKTIEGERSASTGLERKVEMLKKELSGMEKKFEIAVLDKRRARSHVTDSKKECEDLARQLASKDKTLIAKEKENAQLLQSRDALATNCINLRAALRYMEKENTNLRKEVVDARFISHHLEGEVERLRKDVLGMQNGLPCAVVNGNVRSSAVEVQGLSSIQPTVLSLPQNCDISVQIETMRGELACLRHENVCSNEDAFTFFHATLLCWNSFCFEHSFSWKRCVVFLSQCSCSRQRRNMLLKVLWSLCWTEGAE
jgi:chromosome segregation ATPase